MTRPLLTRRRVVGAKIETTEGTPVPLAAADAGFNAYDVSIQASIDVQQRESEGTFNRLAGVPGARTGTCSFKTEVSAEAFGNYGGVLLPACGFIGVSGTFNPLSEPPNTNVKTITIGVWEDGMFKSLAGAMGTWRLVCPNGRLAYFEWDFTGVWQPPVDGLLPSPTVPTEVPMRFAGTACTYAGATLQVESVTIDAANEIVMREDPATAAGFKNALVVDRYPKITANPESRLVTNENRFQSWIDGGEGPFALSLNGADDTSLTVTAPAAQYFNIQEGERGKMQTDEIELMCNQNGQTKDRELSLVLDDGSSE